MYQRDESSTGNSNWQGDAYLIELLHLYRPRTVLDLGVGKWAKMGNLIRRSVDEWNWIQYRDATIEIVGVEGFRPNIEYIRSNFPRIYDDIFHADIEELIYNLAFCIRENLPYYLKNRPILDFDVVILGDVLEHFRYYIAFNIIANIQQFCRKAIIVQLPLGEYPQEFELNPLENHKSTWNPDDIKLLRPAGLKKFTDYSGREFVIFSIPK